MTQIRTILTDNKVTFGNIGLQENIDILNLSFEDEKKFNNPTIGFTWVKERYQENKERYGRYLYEAEKIQFIDTDVFRQSAIHFEEYGKYTLYDPDYDMRQYNEFWDREEYRRLNGMTAYAGLEEDGKPRLVWCPPKLYGFLNYAPMMRRKDEIDDIVQGEHITDDNKVGLKLLKGFFDEIADTKVGEKQIGFPLFFDEQYHIAIARLFAQNIGKNFFYGKARRKGQSYWNAWCAYDNADLHPNTTTIQAAHDKLYLIKGDKALFNLTKAYADHIEKHTDWAKARSKNTAEQIRFGYYIKGEKPEHGFKSEVQVVSAQSNPNVTVGKDCYEIQYEEMGIFPNFKASFQVTTSTTEAGDAKTGLITGWGTGGTKDAQWEAFEEVMYYPDAYNSLPCNNIWDDNKLGTACSYFYPHVAALEGCMDKFGNTLIDEAWKSYNIAKQMERDRCVDERSFTLWCGQRANSPQDAFSRTSDNIFPGDEIRAQLEWVLREPAIRNAIRCGVLIMTRNGVKLQTNEERQSLGLKTHPPLIWDFPLKNKDDMHGCFVEFAPPYKDDNSNVPTNLYIAWQDPYAHSKDLKNLTTRDSLGATYIYERPNNITPSGGGKIVGIWVGRPAAMDDYNEQCMYALIRYNAKMLFENNMGDTKRYFKEKKCDYLLYDEPELLFDKEVQSKSGRGKGIHMTPERKARGAIYLKDKLLEVVGQDADGKPKLFLHYIYDAAFLKELLKWSMTGNFDRVSSWIVGMYIIKELLTVEIKNNSTKKKSFWNRNFYK
jgi:hypothetical protein